MTMFYHSYHKTSVHNYTLNDVVKSYILTISQRNNSNTPKEKGVSQIINIANMHIFN